MAAEEPNDIIDEDGDVHPPLVDDLLEAQDMYIQMQQQKALLELQLAQVQEQLNKFAQDDVVTLQPIREPVKLVYPDGRVKGIFEFSTLMKHILCKRVAVEHAGDVSDQPISYQNPINEDGTPYVNEDPLRNPNLLSNDTLACIRQSYINANATEAAARAAVTARVAAALRAAAAAAAADEDANLGEEKQEDANLGEEKQSGGAAEEAVSDDDDIPDLDPFEAGGGADEEEIRMQYLYERDVIEHSGLHDEETFVEQISIISEVNIFEWNDLGSQKWVFQGLRLCLIIHIKDKSQFWFKLIWQEEDEEDKPTVYLCTSSLAGDKKLQGKMCVLREHNDGTKTVAIMNNDGLLPSNSSFYTYSGFKKPGLTR